MLTNRKYTLLAVLFTFACYLGTTGQDVGCGDQWFDTGGQTGNYSNFESTVTTFCPDNVGDVVTLTFNYVDIEANAFGVGIEAGCWDFIEVFDGPDTNSPSLGVFCGEESGDGSIPSVASSQLNVGDAFTSTNPDGCLTVAFESDDIVVETGWEAQVTCAPPPNCVSPEFSIETTRNCDDFNFDADITIETASPAAVPLLVVTAEVGGTQLGSSTVLNQGGQTVTLQDLPLDENVLISINVLGFTCPTFETVEVISNGCPIPLTCGEAIETTYCYTDNDDQIWLYESPADEPVTIVFSEGLIAFGDEISIYDGVDDTGVLLFSGRNDGDLFGLSATAPSGDLFLEVESSAFGSCTSGSTAASPWTWFVGCGEFDVPGCTDPTALNFLAEATIDNGSCVFPPENDDICDALPIECGVPVDGLTLSATDDGLEPCGGSSLVGSIGAGVWYEFTPDFDAIASFSTCNDADFDTQILVFAADDCTDDLICVDGDDDNVGAGCTANSSLIEGVDIFVGQTYYVFVGGFGSAEGFFTLSIECEEVTLDCEGLGDIGNSCSDGDDSTENDVVTEDCLCVGSPRPAGEVCGISIEVGSLPYSVTDATDEYVDDYGDADIPPLTEDGILVGSVFSTAYLNSNEVIYAYTPSENQLIDILLENVGNDVGMYVFTGCDFEATVASHTAVSGGIREIEALPVDAGTTYYIAIGTSDDSDTNYDLSIFLNTNDCENLGGDIGDSCDDGDPFTTNDLITEDCECIGTPTVQGQICENPILVSTLPYTASDNTDNYVDDYDFEDVPDLADDGIQTGSFFSKLYFSGNEVFYEYTPSEDQLIDVVIDNVGGFAGLFIFTGCPFESTIGAHTNFDGDSREVIGLPVTAGVTYYIAISADSQVQNTPYDLSIAVNTNDCTELGGDFGDPCDDGDDDTINDAITEDCECEGTPEPLSQCGFFSSSPDLIFGSSQESVTDEIIVEDIEATILDLNLVIQINHGFTGDIIAKLISPIGTEVDLIPANVCFTPDVEVLLDDDGPDFSCNTGVGPSLYGTFAPQGSLADFNGEELNGTWTLELSDAFPPADDGTLVTWCLSPTLEFTGGGDDECEDAMSIVATPEFAGSETAVSMAEAVASGEAQCINSGNPQADMWFSFESVTTNMYVRAWGLNDFDAAVEVYDACGGELLNCQNDEPAGEREVLIIPNTTVGETYYFRVYHAGDSAPVEQDYTVAVAHIPFTQLSEEDCGVLDYSPADMITTDLPVNQFLLTNWYFEFTELEAPFNTYEIISPNGANPNFMLEWFPQAEYGRTYEVRTRARMYQGPQLGDYGDACIIGFQSEPLTTQLIEEQALGFYDMCDILEADNVPGAELYRWKFYDSFEDPIIYDSPNRFCQLDLVPGLSLGSPYAITIRVLTQGVPAPIGEIRLIAMNNFVPDTQLDNAITECGATYPLNTVISAINICAAEFYTFRFTNISDANQPDLFFTRDDGLRSINLTSVTGLVPGDTYSVQILGGSGGLVGTYGPACEITIAGAQSGLAEINSGNTTAVDEMGMEIYPNPTDGEEVVLNLTNLSREQQEVMVEIYDLYGKKVHSKILGNNGSQMTAVLSLPELASGIYTVNVIVNEERLGAKKLVVR